jgi:quercetin dioxygenase-like cupin family protein
MEDGTVIEMKAGDLFYIPPGHDSWVVRDEECVSFHFLGAGPKGCRTNKAQKVKHLKQVQTSSEKENGKCLTSM